MIDVVCGDAFAWLREPGSWRKSGAAFVASLPDAEEIGIDFLDYPRWFWRAATAVLNAAHPTMPVMFFQTDRKHNGQWFSKPYRIMEAAERDASTLLWHKIVLRRDVGKTDLHRPGYSHLMCFSRLARPGTATPDVIASSPQLYKNGAPWAVAALVAEYAKTMGATSLVNPFCGRGTFLAAANDIGLDAVGIELDPAQCELARAVTPLV